MLTSVHRLTGAQQFSAAVRRGARRGSATLVVHLLAPAEEPADASDGPGATTRVGFVVSRAVGGSVVRNRVKRRLRHLAAARLDAVPAGSWLVVRALPAAADASSARLAADLDRALDRLVSPAATARGAGR